MYHKLLIISSNSILARGALRHSFVNIKKQSFLVNHFDKSMNKKKLTFVESSTCAIFSCFTIPYECKKLPPNTKESHGV